MDIEGTYTLQAIPEDVWLCLMDSRLLQKSIPGLEQLERQGELNYTIAMQVKQAPLMGTYHGHVAVVEQKFPTIYSLKFEGEGRQSNVQGTIVLTLSEQGENTVVDYKCTLNLGKMGTLLPAPLVKGNIKHLFQQFFAALAEHLRSIIPYPIDVVESNNDILISSTSQQQKQAVFLPSGRPAFLYALVRLFNLGDGDTQQEELWVNRVRRAGVISGLLLLVWIGTRLPRK
jgi:carbon monoxide dehydrogenase subunit G